MDLQDVMIDIETLGNGKHACIVQIGACYFNRSTGEIGRKFKVNVDPESAVRAGCEIDAQTVMWWLKQSDAARASILADPKLDITEAFKQLNTFLMGAKYVWSHATFDFVIITNTFRMLGLKPFYRYQSARDIRTLMDLADLKPSEQSNREGTHHDGLDDAIYQVQYCVKALNKLKTGG
jgi:hypothetical protein